MTSLDTMMNDKRTMHTPGPWTLYEGQWGDQSSGGFHIIFGPHQPGSVHTSRLIEYCEDTFPEDGWYIEAAANARLIAAAPDLLEALKKARGAFSVEYAGDGSVLAVGYDSEALRPLIAKLDAAIAAAEVQS